MLKRIWQLFTFGLWMGSTIFGGISAAYPVIRAKAEESGWLAGEEVDGLYAVSVFVPGPSFLNLWGAVAVRVAGMPGAIAAQVGLLLPAFLLVWSLPVLGRISFIAVRAGGIMQGTVWATAGLLLAAGAEGLLKLKNNPQRYVAAVLFALLLLGIHPLALLGLSVAAGVVWSFRPVQKEGV